jgi:tRNA-binding protein
MEINWDDFAKIDMRVGTIIEAHDFPEARMPAYKLLIDFGDFGELKSSAQITKLYSKEELIGKQIIAVVNFPPKQIANMKSECLVLGAVEDNNEIKLLSVDVQSKNGTKIG